MATEIKQSRFLFYLICAGIFVLVVGVSLENILIIFTGLFPLGAAIIMWGLGYRPNFGSNVEGGDDLGGGFFGGNGGNGGNGD